MSVGRSLEPGRYGLHDLQVGDWIQTECRAITGAMIDDFATLSGDAFAVHMDDAFATDLGFPGRIAHGLLVLSVVDGLKNATPAQFDAVASLGWHWNFRAPIFPDDTVRAVITVQSLRETSTKGRGIASLGIQAFNQDSIVVEDGENLLMVRS